jgi:hypothetical protein
VPGELAYALREVVIIQRLATRVEPGEFLELQHRPAHYETASRVSRRFVLFGSAGTPQSRYALVIFEYSRIGER